MSKIDINFLRQRHKELTVLQKTDRRYAMIMGYVTGAVVFASIGLFALQIYLTVSVDGVKKKQTTITSQIVSMSSVEVEYLTLAQKLNEIKSFLKGRTVQQEAIEYFAALFLNQAVNMTEVTREKEGSISFKVTATDVFQMQQLMSQLQTAEVLSKYPSLKLSDLSRTKTGLYATRVSVVLLTPTPAPQAKKTVKPSTSPTK